MENQEFEAVYEDGVFKPVGSVTLPEQTRVIVRTSDATPDGDREAAKRRMFESLTRSYETGQADLAAKHNEHQP